MHRLAFGTPIVLLASALALPAQTFNEIGDAGDLPLSAQVPAGTITNLTAIAGTLAGDDVDMYVIDIVDPAAFTASTVGGTTLDTQLFLFFADGRGVTHQDGITGATGPQSTITGQFVPYPGTYLLAVNNYNRDPIAKGQLIWQNAPFNDERAPDGPRRREPIDGWNGQSFAASTTYTIALTGVTSPGKTVVLPDNHHLSESTLQVGAEGSNTWWRNGGGRFQVIYEGSHFTSAGVIGSVFLDKLMFRGEDGEPNRGGQSWANVQVRLGRTNLAPSALGTNFALNLAAAINVETVTFPLVTVARSIGSTPNNYNIQLDLFNSPINGYSFNPTLGNLLIDVTIPAAATVPAGVGPVMDLQDTTGGLAVVRGAGISTATTASLTGILSTSPPVMAFKIDGTGGRAVTLPARNETYSAACGGEASTFYEGFLTGQPFDLVGLTLTPNNPTTPTTYTVTAGAGAFDATRVNATPSATGDGGAATLNLGFAFAYPGGSTTAIRATVDGFAWLAAAGGSDFSVTAQEFLTAPARLAPCWYDFHADRNTASNANAGVHVLVAGTAPNRVAYVTWLDVGTFESVSGAGIFGHGVYNLQLAIFETTNVVEFRYGSMPSYTSNNENDNPSYNALVGFSRGGSLATPLVDPQSRDLSVEVPFTTSVEGTIGNIGQRVLATPTGGGVAYNGRAFAGQQLTFDAVGVPAGTVIGAQLLDIVVSRPGLSVPGIHPLGCGQGVFVSPVVHQVFLLPSANVVGTVPLPVPPGVEGAEVYAQFVVLDGLLGGPTIMTRLSNAVRIQVGQN